MDYKKAKQLVDQLLEREYLQAAGQTLNTLTANTATGVVAKRLAELATESQRLADAGQLLSPDNAVFLATRQALADLLRTNGVQLDNGASAIVQNAVTQAATTTRQLALPNITNQQLATIGIRFNTPDPEAVQSLVDVSNKPAWNELLRTYRQNNITSLNQSVLTSFIMGESPLRAAERLSNIATEMPLYTASTIARTLYLYSYRQATAVNQVANADISARIVRVAVLDGRTCMACIALHGTEVPIGTAVSDHWNGRCIGVMQIKGAERPVQSGEDWFNTRTQEQQIDQMGNAAYLAWKARAIRISDLANHTRDPLFGEMVQEASLKGLLGEGAKRFYRQPIF